MQSPLAQSAEVILKNLEIAQEEVFVGDESFLINHPVQSDKLATRPEVRAALGTMEYQPYWAELWPAARMLAKVIHSEKWTPGTQALEIGCGLGLAGIVALSRGLRVIFSDHDPCAVKFAGDNARLNGFNQFEARVIDWNDPIDLRVPVLLGSDLIYEVGNVAPVVSFIRKVLAPDGICLLTDQDRIPSETFRAALDVEGLKYTTQMVRAGEPGGRRLKGTLYRIGVGKG